MATRELREVMHRAPLYFFLLGVILVASFTQLAVSDERRQSSAQEHRVVRGATAALLADAIESQEYALARELLNRGENINAAQADGMTALHWAVYLDKPEWVKTLIDGGADVRLANRYGVRPLSIACRNGNPAIVTALLGSGADSNGKLPGDESVLHTASRTGNEQCVRMLVEAGAEVDATDRRKQTPLMWAAAAGNADAVTALLEAGAAPSIRLNSGFTAFFFAVREGHLPAVTALLDAGEDVNQSMRPKKSGGKSPKAGTTAFLLAVENGHLELAIELLNRGADVNDSRLGYTALHALSWVRKPLRGDGDPPPNITGRLSTLDFAEALILRGAEVDALHGKVTAKNLRLDRTNATPLLLAAETGDLPLVQLLVRHGANPLAKTAANCTPLLAAAGVGVIGDGDETAGTEEEAIETIRYLLSKGADINAVDDDGKTAMHGAAFKSWTKLIEFLVEHEADARVWHREMKRGWTPLDIALGNRPGNFRPSAPTIAAVKKAMRESGVEIPEDKSSALKTE